MNNKKEKKSKKAKEQNVQQVEDLDDPRFASVHTDHRFKNIQKKQTKVKIDKRFQKMFDKDFEIEDEAPVDQYGRKNKKSRKERLTDLYYVDDEDKETEKNTNEDKLERLNRLARGEVSLSESSSSESSSSDEESENEEELKSKIDKKIEENENEENEEEQQQEEEEIPMGDITMRIGLVNLDWDHIRAVDIFAALNSFCKRGDIKSKEENEYGPEGKIVYENPNDLNNNSDNEEEEEKKDIDFDKDVEELDNPEEVQKRENIKLREYEKQRLKYYFAVVECNSLDASSSIYDQCDGFEFLQSGNIFDMRYIPDDIKFDDREMKDKATDVPENYEPIDFTTSALEHTKVKLTWDEEDEEKKKVLLKWGNMNLQDIENDFSNYIGSESSSDESDIEEKKNKYASLLKDIHKNYDTDSDDNDINNNNNNNKDDNDSDDEENGEKEIKFVPSLSKKIEDKIKSKFEDQNKNVYDKYLEKRKMTRKERRKQKEEKKLKGKTNSISSSTVDPDDEFFDWSKIDEMRNKEEEESNKQQMEVKKSKKKLNKKSNKPQTEEEKKNKAQLELLMSDNDDDNNKNYDMNDILIVDQKKKNKIRKHTDEFHLQEGFKIDTTDSRFAGLYKSSEYHIDPTDPHFKPTENMKKLVEEVHKRRYNEKDNKNDEEDENKNKNKKNKEVADKKELEFLAQTVKRKVNQSIKENNSKKQKINKKD